MRLYLSSPISNGGAASLSQRDENCIVASEFALSLMDKGYSVLCPAWSEYGERAAGRKMAHADWIDNDLAWIEVSHALYRLPGESKGADAEVAFAKECGVPVFTDVATMEEYFRTKGMMR